MYRNYTFLDIDNHRVSIPYNIVSLSYTDISSDPSFVHSHQYTEIMIVLEGKGFLTVNNEKIPFVSNTLYLINPNTEHTEITNSNLKYYVLKLKNFAAFFKDSYVPIVRYPLNNDDYNKLIKHLQQTINDYNNPKPRRNDLLTLNLAYLYYYLLDLCDTSQYYINHKNPRVTSAKLQAVINYIDANLGLELKVCQIAKQFLFSHNNLIYHFQKEFQMSPSEYILLVRIQAAKNLLSATDYTVLQIATLCGFSNASFFAKMFKQREHLTPTRFRQQHKK